MTLVQLDNTFDEKVEVSVWVPATINRLPLSVSVLIRSADWNRFVRWAEGADARKVEVTV
jgi:siroheme synthase (precorrin-2 oxidase/ferrochelatase)